MVLGLDNEIDPQTREEIEAIPDIFSVRTARI
jgi:hypothetical protein